MLNKLLAFLRQYKMVSPGDSVTCAVSGGADSVALLFALYLLKDKLGIRLSAAHFNHNLRGEESLRDEQFVRALCCRYEIPLAVGSGEVKPGKKGLEAAAREARYTFLKSLPGKIATAHTADDNGETVLLHLVRGTGLKGLGGIAPVNGRIIRPMLAVTREEVEAFLTEWGLTWIQDSSNEEDSFLRNRLRHHVMPLLRQENPKLAQNLSAMAQRLRLDEECLSAMSQGGERLDIAGLRQTHPAVRSRMIERFLTQNGVKEPEAVHIRQVEALLFSANPSARVQLPGGVVIARNYGILEAQSREEMLQPLTLACPGAVETEAYRISCQMAEEEKTENSFLVVSQGELVVRSRMAGDTMRLHGGTKTLKKLFIDRKIPAPFRSRIPVVADDLGVLAVAGIGVNLDRTGGSGIPVRITIEKKTNLET